MTKKISATDLVPMNIFLENEPVKIDLAYADANHPENIFGNIYHDTAQLWTHRDLAPIILLTARSLHKKFDYILELKDSLRTVDAQEEMQETDIVKANPHWCIDGPERLLAPPGHGGHPRGMAVDVCVLDQDDQEIDMGTKFDHMEPDAARGYKDFDDHILKNRQDLEDAFMKSAIAFDMPFLPLPSEWWDFRFPASHYNQYEPLRDANLPPQMQMTNKTASGIPDFGEKHFQSLAESIIHLVDKHDGNL